MIMNTRHKLIIQAVIAASLAATSLSASADRDGHGGHDGHERHDEHERHERHDGHERHDEHGWHGDIRHFDRDDSRFWRGGGWRHGWHDGRFGWWWLAAGTWYFYSFPIYPYPDPYIPPVVVVNPPLETVPAPPVQYWYFCAAANGYYPYVPSCPEGWETVPASPADATG